MASSAPSGGYARRCQYHADVGKTILLGITAGIPAVLSPGRDMAWVYSRWMVLRRPRAEAVEGKRATRKQIRMVKFACRRTGLPPAELLPTPSRWLVRSRSLYCCFRYS